MSILLTGGSGMVGKNLLALATKRGVDILAPGSGELNLLDYPGLERYLASIKPELVIHCAGIVGGIQANIERPYEFCRENMVMGFNLIEACRVCDIRKVLNLGSSCMYPRNIGNPLKEDQILSGELEPTNEGYALAKLGVARLCFYANKEYNMQYKTIIPCNLYGYWDDFSDNKSHMVPAVIKKVYKAIEKNIDSVHIWGDGESRREFMFAEDLADFILQFYDKIEELPDIINIGLGNDYSINEYYKMVADELGYVGNFIHDLDKPTGMKQKLIDISRQKQLGWMPPTSILEGIHKTCYFYKQEVFS